MIWLVLVAAVFVAGGAWFVAKSTATRGIVLVAGLAAIGAYWMFGKPDMYDQPLEARLVEIERIAKQAPETLTNDQLLALAKERALKFPQDPMPHWIEGELLEAAGRGEDALMAYESALRRDPAHVPTIKSLADLRFKMTGQIDPATTMLYHQAYAAEPDNLRAGYMAGIGDWQQGRKAEAEAFLAAIDAKTPEGDQRRLMFKALREAFMVEAPAPAPETPKPETPKPPG